MLCCFVSALCLQCALDVTRWTAREVRGSVRIGALIILSWAVFSGFRLFLEDTPTKSLLSNTAQNITSYLFILLYARMATPGADNPGAEAAKEHRTLLTYGYGLLLVGVFILELLQWSRQEVVPHHAADLIQKGFTVFSGVFSAVAMFLFIGRLEDPVVLNHQRDRLRKPGRTSLVDRVRLSMFGAYVYAALQAAYPILFEEDAAVLRSLLLVVALVLKLLLICFIKCLLTAELGRLSTLEHFFLEAGRFHVEERGGYERLFIRRHIDPEHRLTDRRQTFLGVEYQRMGRRKREALGSGKDQDGLWLTDVYPGSPAMMAGLRVGDLLTHVRDHPIGADHSLRTALNGTTKGQVIKLTFLRPSARIVNGQNTIQPSVAQHHAELTLAQFRDLPHRRIIRVSRPYLGLELVDEHPDQGVWVRKKVDQKDDQKDDQKNIHVVGLFRPFAQRTHVIPDLHALRLLRQELLPGEPVELVTGDGSLQRTVLDRFGMRHGRTCAPWARQLDGDVELSFDGSGDLSFADSGTTVFQRYRDRFDHRSLPNAAGRVGLFGLTSFHPRIQVIRAFDEHLDLLFEYCIPQHLEPGRLKDHITEAPIWQFVPAGRILLYFGERLVSVNDDFNMAVHLSSGGWFQEATLQRTLK